MDPASLLKCQCAQVSPGDFPKMQIQEGWDRAWGSAFPPWSYMMLTPCLERSEEEEMTLDVGSKDFTGKKEPKQGLEG